MEVTVWLSLDHDVKISDQSVFGVCLKIMVKDESQYLLLFVACVGVVIVSPPWDKGVLSDNGWGPARVWVFGLSPSGH